ncbi:MAG TPA: Spy/CpxP family protein refolding chaperone [Xanthobacteraceae bacterium]|nr:Spy/CpxP family protein refolding chaperone [Xanthobacteraceae bacterium]
MRAWTIPILGAVAFSLAAPPIADARPRFGPAVLLGAMAAPLGMLGGGSRYSARHHRRSAARANDQRGDSDTRAERRAASAFGAAATPVFWPDASTDLVDYLLFPSGSDERFWAYGYGAIVGGAFAGSLADEARVPRGRRLATGDETVLPREPDLSASLCDRSATDVDALIARIEQAIAPNPSQRELLDRLRSALAQASEGIKSSCPAALPATPAQRLKAIQDRIWAMRDGLLTIRLPLEKFYDSLTGEQQWRLQREQPDARETARRPLDTPTQMCGASAAASTEASLRAIGRAVQPAEPQLASFEGLRLRSAAMARLIAESCPTYPLLGHMGRLDAAADRLDVMLFAVMTMSPVLQDFYDSLDDRQKRNLGRALRQLEQSPGMAAPRS